MNCGQDHQRDVERELGIMSVDGRGVPRWGKNSLKRSEESSWPNEARPEAGNSSDIPWKCRFGYRRIRLRGHLGNVRLG